MEIPRGNTQKNVNRTVVQQLKNHVPLAAVKTFLDLPCGEGQFIGYIKKLLPQARVIGIDKYAVCQQEGVEFYQTSSAEFFKKEKVELDVLTCISGIMCFDGIEEILTHFFSHLRPGGFMVITNDNVITVRDRLHFLLFGRFKRFKLLPAKQEGNWNVVLPSMLVMHLEKKGFKVIDIKYTSVYIEDFIFLPLALVMYPVFCLYFLLSKNHWSFDFKRRLFPFKSMIARHYVISLQKPSDLAQ